jgi:hypothetical protein
MVAIRRNDGIYHSPLPKDSVMSEDLNSRKIRIEVAHELATRRFRGNPHYPSNIERYLAACDRLMRTTVDHIEPRKSGKNR